MPLGADGRGTRPPLGLEAAIERVAKLYPVVAPDSRWWTPEGALKEFSDEMLIAFVRETSRLDTSPGFPWVQLGCATVGHVLEKYPQQLCEVVRESLLARLRLSLDEARAMTPSQLAKCSYRAVVRVFIKKEPHSLRKLAVGRYRLIMNSGLSDILVDRIALEALANAEVDDWATLPSKPGMGLDDQSILELQGGVPKGKVLSSDAKAFDFHVSEWSMDAAASVEIRQYRVREDSDLARLIRASVVATCRKVFQLSTGHLFEQVEPGIQETGSRMTACRNSKIRVLLAYLAGAEWCCAMGDDALEQWLNGLFDPQGNYKEFGHEMEVAELPDGVLYEFCSHHFTEQGQAIPLNWAKTFYRLLGHSPDRLLLRQYAYEMRASPMLMPTLEWAEENWLK